jgi:transcriptional regulator with XRE-family HTH domain
MELEQIVAANVRRLRRERGWTQERLAQEVEISTRYVGLVERAQTSVTVAMLARLAMVLDVPAAALIQPRA